MAPAATSDPGPDRPTLVERAIGRLPLSYPASCFVLASVFGAPGVIVVEWSHSHDLGSALVSVSGGLASGPGLMALAYALLWWVIPFASFWLIRWMRQRVADAGAALAPILPGGEADGVAIFRRISATGPALLLGLAILGLSSEYLVLVFAWRSDLLWLIYNALRLLFVNLAFGTLVWVYLSGLRGLDNLGRLPLRLRPIEEDAMLGLRPVGRLAVALASAYFGFLALVTLPTFVSPAIALQLPIMVALMAGGLLLFVLPLRRTHRQMAAVKASWQRRVRRQLLNDLETLEAAGEALGQAGPDLASALDRLTRVQVADAAGRRIDALPTWPLDPDNVRQLATLTLPVALAIITDIVRRLMGL